MNQERAPLALTPDMTGSTSFTVEAGETTPFVLSYGPSHLPPPTRIDPALALSGAEAFWRDWTDRSDVSGPHAEAIRRSLITLKALPHAPTDGVVAAATTSLPE